MRLGNTAAATVFGSTPCRLYQGATRILTVPAKPEINEPNFSTTDNGIMTVYFLFSDNGGSEITEARLYSDYSGTLWTSQITVEQDGVVTATFDELLNTAPDLYNAITGEQVNVSVRCSLGNDIGWSLLSEPLGVAQ